MKQLICAFLLIILTVKGIELECGKNSCYCIRGDLTQVFEPIVNGCGPKNNHIATPPDWEFDKICNEHDKCYGTCRKDKRHCDEVFGNDLTMKCIDNVSGGESRDYCMTIAYTMYEFVKNFGTSYFQNAQREDCLCM